MIMGLPPVTAAPARRPVGILMLVGLLIALTMAGCCFRTTAGVHLPNGVAIGNKFYCFRGFKRCPSNIKQCIAEEKECDGVKDCSDGSDEGSRCKKYDCEASGRFTCPSGNMCMNVSNWRHSYKDPYKYYLCDGVKDCADGSDENPRFCSSYDCVAAVKHKTVPMTLEWSKPSSRRMRCPGNKGGCVFESELCDGVVQCADRSDEADAFCKKRGCPRTGSYSNHFQCRSGRCLVKDRMCDGKRDCPDGDDEGSWCARAECPGGRVKCPGGNNQTCIDSMQRCDGRADCPGGTDELGCAAFECPTFKCPSNRMCAATWGSLCDGVKDCRDGSDEDPAFCRKQNCSEDYVKCKDGLQCVYNRDFCNGLQDCRDASDEDPKTCTAQKTCGEEYVKCPGKVNRCIYRTDLCDNYQDCLDSSDENPTFCKSERARRLILESGQRVTCASNKTAFVYGSFCDGQKDCKDGSDESSSFCKTYTCPKDRVKCYGTWCVYGKRCDGNPDCPDGSDERGCGRAMSSGRRRCVVKPGTSILDCPGVA